jgi:site-specific recombinase XerD
MTLTEATESYLRLKRSLGAVFAADARILRAFGRVLGDVPLDAISREACHVFCRGAGPPTRFWERKHQTLRGFFRYLTTRGQVAASPLPHAAPRVPRSFQAYIYSRDELRRLLEATSILETPRTPQQPLTFRTLLLVLYGAGLRPGEALRLRRGDVDLGDRILAIWDTKCFKSRLVPIGPDLCKALEAYWTVRQRLPLPDGTRSAFFCTGTGRRISLAKLERLFVRLREHAGIQRPASDRWQPRLHDLRHAFAVHRVIAWYREGADVQACLPLLATYLGHINLSGTQTYLTMTRELLGEASQRFERYAALDPEDAHD